jgi:hypothetical protein
MSGRWTSPGTFFSDADFDFETRATLGRVANGAGNVGLVFATLDQITDGDAQSWFDAWTATASTLAARGDDGVKRGQLATASWAMLTAASYYAKALAMVDGLADQSALLPTFPRAAALLGGGHPRVAGALRPGAGPLRGQHAARADGRGCGRGAQPGLERVMICCLGRRRSSSSPARRARTSTVSPSGAS